ncbi:hypothetical protein [Pontibacter vulgaris]|uniref:hypothetical protein n=1 Tax=Pontibacter vulgaris TaxID=2905679 RepID=UPI001FA72004|nr:hypothetical protein [Pontibacter vulgaris]
MKRLQVLLAITLLFLAACKSGPSEEEQKATLEKTVLDVHDEAMAKMGTIHQLKRRLQHLQDSLQTADTAATGLFKRQETSLDKADEAMMSWMHQYQAPDSLQYKEAMQYLQEQKAKIEGVQRQMDSTITAARKLTEQYEPK